MTLKRSQYTQDFVAQCDSCLEIMDFEDEDNFIVCVHILRASDWSAHKEADGRYTHLCPDCRDGK